jgi:CheY-like chemotaxis protein
MTPFLIIVDDAADTPTSYAKLIRDRVFKERDGGVGVILVENVLIENSLPRIKREARTHLRPDTAYLAGILIDLVEPTNKRAGEDLLRLLKADPELGSIPVVVFTGKYVEVDSPGLVALGATAVLQRDVSRERPPEFVTRILKAFNL